MTIEENRKKLLIEILKNTPFDGWTEKSYKHSSEALGLDENYYLILFPAGSKDIVSYFSSFIDKKMANKTRVLNLKEMRIRDKIATLVKIRLQEYAPFKEAVRALFRHHLNPKNSVESMKLLWGTADDMWNTIGDNSTDFNYYSKRTLLSCVFLSTLLYWLSDESEDCKDSWGFLDRRIENVLSIGKIKKFANNIKEKSKHIPFIRLITRKFA